MTTDAGRQQENARVTHGDDPEVPCAILRDLQKEYSRVYKPIIWDIPRKNRMAENCLWPLIDLHETTLSKVPVKMTTAQRWTLIEVYERDAFVTGVVQNFSSRSDEARKIVHDRESPEKGLDWQ